MDSVKDHTSSIGLFLIAEHYRSAVLAGLQENRVVIWEETRSGGHDHLLKDICIYNPCGGNWRDFKTTGKLMVHMHA